VSEQTYFEEAARMYAHVKLSDDSVIPQTYSNEHGTSCQYPTGKRMSDQNTHLLNRIHPSAVIEVDELTLGVGVTIGANVVIKARKVVIDDFVQIGDGCKFFVPELRIGDYSRLGDLVLGIGTKPMLLGRNLYVGRLVRLDSRGGLTIEDNCGIGDSSALWSHIRHGDTVQGCRWDKEYPLVIEHDAWLVAKVTVGGCQRIGARVQVFNESNVTKKELPADTVWQGNPACDVTEKIGPQFEALEDDEKWGRLMQELDRFAAEYPHYRSELGISHPAEHDPLKTWIDPISRTYTKRRSAAEVAFLRFTLAKFVPVNE
jgi:acetyltransferase-like isoleucine patch superfamily enzyme